MCGIVGVAGPTTSGSLVLRALEAVQHRGYEAAGVAVASAQGLHYHRAEGPIGDELRAASKSMSGCVAVGHTRYSTTGSAALGNAHPLIQRSGRRTVAVAHNGNIPSSDLLRRQLHEQGQTLSSATDSECIAAFLAAHPGDACTAAEAAVKEIEPAFSVVAIIDDKLVCFTDRLAIRPLCMGRRGDQLVVASESCALEAVGAQHERELEPGEVLVADGLGRIECRSGARVKRARCVFEHIYFSAPHSVVGGERVAEGRRRSGERLAREAPAPADCVVPVPRSGIPAAAGYAQISGLPLRNALERQAVATRTFILPGRGQREAGASDKFRTPVELSGMSVALVDDSLVRGTTLSSVIPRLREAGVVSVHVRIASPPIRWPCFYGMDFPAQEELLLHGRNEREVAAILGADSLVFLSLGGLRQGVRPRGLCTACLDGHYPTPRPALSTISKLRFETASPVADSDLA